MNTAARRWAATAAAALLAICLATQAAESSKALGTPAAPQLVVQTGHPLGVSAMAYSPDGKLLVSCGPDSTLILWDVASGRQLRTFTGHTSTVNTVAVSPDGKSAASGGLDSTIKLWDLATGRELRTLTGHGSLVESVVFTANGRMLISGAIDNTIKIWDIKSGQELRSIKTDNEGASTLAVSPNGKTILSGSQDGTVREWDFATGRELRKLTGHLGMVQSVAFSPNGRILASAAYSGLTKPTSGNPHQIVNLWDEPSGRLLHSLPGLTGIVSGIAFSPDGKTLAVAAGKQGLTLWDVGSGFERGDMPPQPDPVTTVTFAPDGQTIAGAVNGHVQLWNSATGQKLRSLGGTSSVVQSVAVSPDGKLFASGGYDGISRMWDLANGSVARILAGHRKAISSVAFAPTVGMLASASWDGTLKLWDVLWDGSTGKELLTMMRQPDEIEALAFSADGKQLAVGSAVPSGNTGNQVKLWDMTGAQQPRDFPVHSDIVTAVALSKTGILAAGDYEGIINLWNLADGTNNKFHADSHFIYALSFSPDGKILASGGFAGPVKLWDAEGKLLRSMGDVIRDDRVRSVKAVAFSPDGTMLASAGTDLAVNLYDVASGRQLHSMLGHTSEIRAVIFTPDGNTVISGGADDTVRMWRVSDGSLLATLTSFEDGSWVVTDPQGRFDTSDLESTPYLHWVLPDDPFTALPMELFMRDYYEPRLLTRILNGEKLANVGDILKLNRVQPAVAITALAAVPEHPEMLDISVEAQGASRRYGGAFWTKHTAVHDLRLFRNGQLVGSADGKLASSGSKYRGVFRVRLPGGNQASEFTAYAFNDSHIKSATAERRFTPPAAVTTQQKRAYVITVGVNRPENPDWNLSFAANDARHLSEILVARLNSLRRFEDVVPVALISDEGSRSGEVAATKARLKAVFDRLAGRNAELGDIPNADRLRPALPDDLIIVTFSGHGLNEGDEFYLIPADTGVGRGRDFTPLLRSHAISSNDLANWLRDVDAGDIAMIIDACQSAASVGAGFKPGPMGARGLGQLAYEKGMRILAASQTEESALESDQTQHGLLSYALVNDGLEKGHADYMPKDGQIQLAEWLNYAVLRVPALAEEVAHGNVDAAGTRGARVLYKDAPKKVALQQPALFDFTKGRRDPVLTATPR